MRQDDSQPRHSTGLVPMPVQFGWRSLLALKPYFCSLGQLRLVLDNPTNDHEETALFVAAQYDHVEVPLPESIHICCKHVVLLAATKAGLPCISHVFLIRCAKNSWPRAQILL